MHGSGTVDISSIELPGSKVESIREDGDVVTLRFSPAYIITTISGSVERTRWWQAGELIFRGTEVEGDIPEGHLVCAGGDVGENIYTYRDMLPVRLQGAGRAHCDLRFEGTEQRLRLQAESVALRMEDRPRYIEHIRPE